MSLKESNIPNFHAKLITVLIKEVCEDAGISYQDLDGIAVSKGPGSYTGLRVGTSVAKGLCYSLNIPLFAVSTLKGLALNIIKQSALESDRLRDSTSPKDLFVIPMIDARRMEVYTAVFDHQLNSIQPIQAKILNEQSFSALSSAIVLIGGNGSAKFEALCSLPKVRFYNDAQCSAKFLVDLASTAYANKAEEDIAYFEPLYLKPPNITKPKNIL